MNLPGYYQTPLSRKNLDDLSSEYQCLKKNILNKLPRDFARMIENPNFANPSDVFLDPRVDPELGTIGTLSHVKVKPHKLDLLKQFVFKRFSIANEIPKYITDNSHLIDFLVYMDRFFKLKDPQSPLMKGFKSWAVRHRYPLVQFTKSEWLLNSAYGKIKMFLEATLPRLIEMKVKKVGSGKPFIRKKLENIIKNPFIDLKNLSKLLPDNPIGNTPLKESLDLMVFFVKNFAAYFSDDYVKKLSRGGDYFPAQETISHDVRRSREYVQLQALKTKESKQSKQVQN